ncbi:MAG: ABC transporter permease [Phycisphaerales bacterium]|nr:ABC transporter permease [Phycisphaerales bacterium]
MSIQPAASESGEPAALRRAVEAIGATAGSAIDRTVQFVETVGGTVRLTGSALAWTVRGLFLPSVKLGRASLVEQMVRVGVRSIAIVMLVEAFIGSILALQLAPTLESYGQIQMIANVVAIAIVRELGPLITAIVLSGFAGASIAAEIGAMVESEEIKALRAHAINPIRFLIVPRFLATTMMIVGLAVIADVIGVLGGFLTSWLALGITPETYFESTRAALVIRDFITGLTKAGVFGGLIAMIACHAGMTVKGGAVGVGNATTSTVVKSIVAIIGMDAVFTAIFYAFGW